MTEQAVAGVEGCKWCKYAEKCPKDATCDFSKVPFTKDAILSQMRKEYVAVDVAKKSEDVVTMMDSLYALQVFSRVLREEFDVGQKELESAVVGHSLSTMEKARLVARVMSLKKQRRSASPQGGSK